MNQLNNAKPVIALVDSQEKKKEQKTARKPRKTKILNRLYPEDIKTAANILIPEFKGNDVLSLDYTLINQIMVVSLFSNEHKLMLWKIDLNQPTKADKENFHSLTAVLVSGDRKVREQVVRLRITKYFRVEVPS